MKLIVGDRSITSFIKIGNKLVYKIEEPVFVHITVFAVEPVDNITSKSLVVTKRLFISGACQFKKIICVNAVEIVFEVMYKLWIQKAWSNSNVVVNKTVDEPIE